MNKLKTFGQTFKKSITDFSYYKDILKANFSFSFKYLLFLLFLVTLLSTLVTGIKALKYTPQVEEFETQAYEYLKTAYPSDLVITLDKGEVSINQPVPYAITTPLEWRSDVKDSENDFENLIVFDTSEQISNFYDYRTAVLVSKNAIYVVDNNRGSRSYPLDKEMSGVVDKNSYDQMLVVLGGYLNQLGEWYLIAVIVGMVILPFITVWFVLAWKLLYLLIFTPVIWIIAKIMNRKLDFGQTYRIGIHAITIPILLTLFLSLVEYPISWIHTVLFLMFSVVVLVKIKE